jgi:hypothetical protein
MRAHPFYKFEELEVAFYKHYSKVQMDEQMYKALQMIKQGKDEKVEIYYEHMLKITNCL